MQPVRSAARAYRLVNVLLFACTALCLLTPLFTITIAGKTYAYSALLLFRQRPVSMMLIFAPCIGLIGTLMPMGQNPKLRYLLLTGVCLLGLGVGLMAKPLIFEYGSRFCRYAWGSYAAMALFALGICLNICFALLKRKQGKPVRFK